MPLVDKRKPAGAFKLKLGTWVAPLFFENPGANTGESLKEKMEEMILKIIFPDGEVVEVFHEEQGWRELKRLSEW